MLSYFKSQQPVTVLAFALFFIIVKLPFAFLGHLIPVKEIPSLWGYAGTFAPYAFTTNFLLAQAALLVQAVWFNYLFHKADYCEGSTMVPALYFTMVTSLVPAFNQWNIYLLIGFILLALFHILLTITVKENAKIECFNAGVLGGVLVLINGHFILFVPFLLLMLYALKPFRLNEYLMLLFGIMLPVYFALSASYLFDLLINPSPFYISSFSLFKPKNNILDDINYILVAVYLLFSFVSLRGIMYSTGFKRRKNINMLVLLLLAMTLTVLLSGKLDEAVLSFLFIPTSVFLSIFMLRIRKKRLGEILNAIFVCTICIVNIVRIFR